jgi:carboxyl-terminal processing protease
MGRYARTVLCWISLTILAGLGGCAGPEKSPRHDERFGGRALDGSAAFLEAWTLVRDNFYDESFHGINWEGVRDELLPAARAAGDTPTLAAVVNTALERLRSSHTHYYTRFDREYYELLDIFHPPPEGIPPGFAPTIPPGPVTYVGIGVVAERIGDRVFAADVYDSGPAAAAGMLAGDELVGVEDGPWSDVEAFRGRAGVPTRVRVRRTRGGPVQTFKVTPAVIQPHAMFLAAMERGALVVQKEGHAIAYVRMRSYAHPDFQDKLFELLRTRLARADALVLDLRGPWGGANPEYLSLFNPLTPTLESKGRRGDWTGPMFSWRRPVALVIDPSVRSGKEVIAYAFRKHHLGPLVGSRTGGAVLGGRPFVLSDGSILYLAVQDARVDGDRLEGIGVEPTAPVERKIPYAQGRDEQINAAEKAVAGETSRSN